ncbi:hypothetical protein BCR37DRAFT_380296 [Protomyces lactucae-debilis]|uniref:Replication protein A C-terminal domain-containing protein n=1 Tax=Protomyces lactucae-debilis TaxID=2754530 RepID=A0A1Y2FBY0_PROLT|nr:uncharacterized protein BCR37DRAFT_380296 [Protomyces lactucae-debilis]ORY81401.1 hypothetical protein BCR37DRAFT_380296 [Protomyces lactucae-debilis]
MSYNDNGYSHNNYQSNGGPNGGGYGGGGGGGGFSASQTTPGGGDKKTSSTVLRPVTIKQILDASQTHPDAPFQADGVEILHITFVAKVVNVSSASTHITYKFDDDTGVIEVKKWIDADAADQAIEIENGMHARVLGNMKSFNGKRSVASTAIRKVTDEQEVAYHALETKYASLYLTRGPPDDDSAGANGQAAGAGAQSGQGNGLGQKVQDELRHLDDFSRKIVEAIVKNTVNEDGIHVRTLAGLMGGGGDILATIEALKEEGIIYTTIDEDHVKTTME